MQIPFLNTTLISHHFTFNEFTASRAGLFTFKIYKQGKGDLFLKIYRSAAELFTHAINNEAKVLMQTQ